MRSDNVRLNCTQIAVCEVDSNNIEHWYLDPYTFDCTFKENAFRQEIENPFKEEEAQ